MKSQPPTEIHGMKITTRPKGGGLGEDHPYGDEARHNNLVYLTAPDGTFMVCLHTEPYSFLWNGWSDEEVARLTAIGDPDTVKAEIVAAIEAQFPLWVVAMPGDGTVDITDGTETRKIIGPLSLTNESEPRMEALVGFRFANPEAATEAIMARL